MCLICMKKSAITSETTQYHFCLRNLLKATADAMQKYLVREILKYIQRLENAYFSYKCIE